MVEEGKRKYRLGLKGFSQSPDRNEDYSMQQVLKTVGAALTIALLTWTANTIQKTVVTVAEIQKDVNNLAKNTEKDLTVVNNAVTNLRIEFRDYKNEQRFNGVNIPPAPTNPNKGPGGSYSPAPDGNPRVVPQLHRGDPAGSGREPLRNSALDDSILGDQLRSGLLRPAEQASASP